MPITLAQAQLNTQSDIDYAVIRTLRQYSVLWDRMVWDDTAVPDAGGPTLSYGYHRLLTPRSAAFRPYNQEYTPANATTERLSVTLKPHGGSFTVDRILARLGPAATNQTTLQMQELNTAMRQRWLYELINGDTAVDALGFDGLNKSLTGTSTEYDPLDYGVTAGYVDWSRAAITSQALAMAALDVLDEALAQMVPSTVGGGDLGEDGGLPPGIKMMLGNTSSILRLKALARWAGMYTEDKDDVGRSINRYQDWELHDLGDGPLGASPIIPIYTADADEGGGGGNITNLTDVYAVSIGLDALHAASPAGLPLLQTYLPEFTTPGVMKSGEMEMVSAMALKNTRSCVVIRKVKVR